MPPIRTMPPAKVLKTERTHEENQERAYIAASRRSDRSLEARVESARRASEIHKRRTGRSLRVTEQDVVNEEMYEEEDDDLPQQYRRLTAHLQTGSADFNRRLSAYLTNHVAMRSALDQAITNSYAQQYPNAPQFAHNQSMFPSPFAQGSPQAHSPHAMYGQPYPTPGTPGYRPNHPERRSQSMSQGATSYPSHMSTPTASSTVGSAMSPVAPDGRHHSLSSKSTSHSPVQQRSSAPANPQPSAASGVNGSESARDGLMHSPAQDHPMPPQMNGYPNISPFSMALPMESQMLLNGALDPNDPMTHALMSGSNNMPYAHGFGPPEFSKQRSFSHPLGGMSATLAPSALDLQPRQLDSHQRQGYDSAPQTGVPSSDFGLDTGDFSKGAFLPSSQGSHASGAATPGLEGGWDAFVNDTSWNENAT